MVVCLLSIHWLLLLFLHAFNWLADYVIHMIQHRWSRKILFNFHQKNRSNPRNSIIIVHYNSTYSLSWQTLFIYLRYPFKIFANSHSISFSIYFLFYLFGLALLLIKFSLLAVGNLPWWLCGTFTTTFHKRPEATDLLIEMSVAKFSRDPVPPGTFTHIYYNTPYLVAWCANLLSRQRLKLNIETAAVSVLLAHESSSNRLNFSWSFFSRIWIARAQNEGLLSNIAYFIHTNHSRRGTFSFLCDSISYKWSAGEIFPDQFQSISWWFM